MIQPSTASFSSACAPAVAPDDLVLRFFFFGASPLNCSKPRSVCEGPASETARSAP